MKKLLLLVLLLTSTAAFSAGESLRGLDVIRVVIENLDDDAKRCGITKNNIRSAAELPFSKSRIRIVDSDAKHKGDLYVQVTVLLPKQWKDCVYNVHTELLSGATLKANRKYVLAAIWVDNYLGVAPRSHAMRDVSQVVEGLTKEFIIEWPRDNR